MGTASGNTGEIQFNSTGNLAGDKNLVWAQGGLFVGGKNTSASAVGIISATNEVRIGSWQADITDKVSDYARIRTLKVASPTNANGNVFYGWNTDYQLVEGKHLVITNEGITTTAMVLQESTAYNTSATKKPATVFGISVNNGYTSGGHSTGTEYGWKKMMEVTNWGDLNIGGNLTLNPSWQYIATQPANNQVGIKFADGTFQHTAAGASALTIKDEGNTVVANANTINFVGAGVTTSNVGGVATITITGAGSNTTGNVSDNGGLNAIGKLTGNGFSTEVAGFSALTLTWPKYYGVGSNGEWNDGYYWNKNGELTKGLHLGINVRKPPTGYVESTDLSASFVLEQVLEGVRYVPGQIERSNEPSPYVTFKPNNFSAGLKIRNEMYTADQYANAWLSEGFVDKAQTIKDFSNNASLLNVIPGQQNYLGNATSKTNPMFWPSFFRLPSAEEQVEGEADNPLFRSYNPAAAFIFGSLPAVQGGGLQIYHPRRDTMVHITGNTIIGVNDVYKWNSTTTTSYDPGLKGDLRLQGYGTGNVIISKNDQRDDVGIPNASNKFSSGNIYNYTTGFHNGTQNNLLIEYGNLVIQPVPNVSNNTLGIKFADGSFQYTAAGPQAFKVKDEGNLIANSASEFNFVGTGVTATSSTVGAVTVTIPSTAVAVLDEGTQLTDTAKSLNFVGAGVTAAGSGGNITVTINGGSGSSNLVVADEGVVVANTAARFNFVGAGVTANATGSNVTVTIPGGSSGIAVQEEGSNVVASANTVNFVGAGVTASNVGGVATVTIPGSTFALAVKDEGNTISSTANVINFVGTGVTATQASANNVTVTINSSSLTTQDEGSSIATATSKINFVGAGVTATGMGNTDVTVSIPGNNIKVYDANGNLATNNLKELRLNYFLETNGNLPDNGVVNVYSHTGSGNGTPVAVSNKNTQITSAVTSFNFLGAGVSAAITTGNNVSVTIPGPTPLVTQDEGSNIVATTTTMNFVGAGVTASNVGGVATITIPGLSANPLVTKDEGTTIVANTSTINFVGAGITASNVGGVATVTVPALVTQDEGSTVVAVTDTLNFVGTGIQASNVGNVATVTVNALVTKDEGNTVVPVTNTMNFVGTGVTASNVAGVATVTIPGLVTQDEGSTVVAVTDTLNFVGTGVTASNVGGVATVNIPSKSLAVRDENSLIIADTTSINFVGAGVTATGVGSNSVTVNIPGGGGSAGGLPGYLRTYTGNVTTVTHDIWHWYPLPLDSTSIFNTIGAYDYPNGVTQLPAGTYAFETTVNITASNSDTISSVYTCIIENTSVSLAGIENGQYTLPEPLAKGATMRVGDWQAGTVTAMGKFTITSAKNISVAYAQHPDSYPQALVCGDTNNMGYTTTMLKLWKLA